MQPYLHYLCSYCCQTCIVFGLMSKSTFKLDNTSNSFVVKAEPAGLVLDLHMDMYLVPAWCRSGRFQLHICKIFQNVHDVSDPSDTTSQFSPSGGCGVKKAAVRIFSRYSNANFEITKEDLPEVLGAMATMIIVESPDDHRENHGRGESETCDVVFPPKCCFSLTVLFWCCMLNLLPSLKTKHTAYSAPSYCSRSFQTCPKVGYGFVLQRACFSTEYTPQSQHSTWK